MNDTMLDCVAYCTSKTFGCPVLNASRIKNAISNPKIQRKTNRQIQTSFPKPSRSQVAPNSKNLQKNDRQSNRRFAMRAVQSFAELQPPRNRCRQCDAIFQTPISQVTLPSSFFSSTDCKSPPPLAPQAILNLASVQFRPMPRSNPGSWPYRRPPRPASCHPTIRLTAHQCSRRR